MSTEIHHTTVESQEQDSEARTSPEIATASSNNFLEAALSSTVNFLGSYYLLDVATRYLPIALAAPTPLNIGIAAGATLIGGAMAYSGAKHGGPAERNINLATTAGRIIAPIITPAWAGILRTANIISTALGMRLKFRTA